MSDGPALTFAPHDEIEAAKDQDRLNCLAAAIVNQQAAGFGTYLDTREVNCSTCKASGFNTGWGYWQFACGMEVMSGGEVDTPCPHDKSAAA